jgi:hypothetical protein
MKWLLILGVIVVLLFATGGIHFEFYSTTDPAPASAGSENQVSYSAIAPAVPPGLGAGVRTSAEMTWLRRMNAVCAQRNRREDALPGPEDTTLALARYSAQTAWIWDESQRRASSLRAPSSYRAEYDWFGQAETLKRAGIQNVFNAARSDDKTAAHSAISAFQGLSAATYRTYAKIGLATCGRFHP